MKIPLTCPHCQADLKIKLPRHMKEHENIFGTKAIGWIDRDRDCLVRWQCQICLQHWERND